MVKFKKISCFLLICMCFFTFFACKEYNYAQNSDNETQQTENPENNNDANNIDGIEDQDDYVPTTPEELAFEKFTNDLLALEALSKQYNQTNYISRVVIYIRSSKYNTNQWSILGGSIDEDFANYVHNNNAELEYLRTKEVLTYPGSNEEIDFIHMIATINLSMIGNEMYSDLGGWGGDLCQLVKEIKNTDKTDDELKTMVEQKFNHNSSFGSQDVLADFDAINITNLYNNLSEKSLAKAIKKYYREVTNITRKDGVKSYLFDGKNNLETISQKVDFLYSRLCNNQLLVYLNNTYEIDFENHKNLFDACLTVFVEFLYI